MKNKIVLPQSVEQEVATLEPDVATVISRGDTLTLTTHMVDVPRANNIRVAVRDLRQQWASLKTLTEVRGGGMSGMLMLDVMRRMGWWWSLL